MWSKTIQFLERVAGIQLPSIPGSALCPTAAFTNAFRITSPVSTRGLQAFNWVDDSLVWAYSTFVSKLRSHLSIRGWERRGGWLEPSLHAGHSFRRGKGSFIYYSLRFPKQQTFTTKR